MSVPSWKEMIASATAKGVLAEADPMHASGAGAFRIRPWLMSEDGPKLRVTFSDGKQRLI